MVSVEMSREAEKMVVAKLRMWVWVFVLLPDRTEPWPASLLAVFSSQIGVPLNFSFAHVSSKNSGSLKLADEFSLQP